MKAMYVGKLLAGCAVRAALAADDGATVFTTAGAAVFVANGTAVFARGVLIGASPGRQAC